MLSQDFVESLARCQPTVETLKAFDSSAVSTDLYRQGFRCRPKANAVHNSNPVLDLIGGYHAEELQLSGVVFLPATVELERGWRIGKEDADYLLLDRTTGEIRLEEHFTDGHILSFCAVSGGHFLDALLLAACYPHYDPSLTDDDAVKRAEECTQAAGGEKYRNFYLGLLGCEEVCGPIP